MLKAAVLGVLQGLTEFLPVSSTAHLIILRWLTNWNDAVLYSVAFDVALHLGTLLSLLVCFRADIADMLVKDRRLLFLITLGTVPAALAGVFLENIVENSLRRPEVIVFSLALIGVVMIVSERFRGSLGIAGLSTVGAVLIGIAQAIALVPGVSRSGITIASGLFLGLGRQDAARFAFLLSVPVIAGAVLLEGRKLLITHSEAFEPDIFGIGILASFVAGIFAIRFLMSYLQRHRLHTFSYYRFGLAAVITLRLLAL